MATEQSTDLATLWLVPAYPWADDSVSGSFHETQARVVSRLGVAVSVLAPSVWSPWPVRVLRDRWRRHAAIPRSSRDGDVVISRPRFVGIPRHPEWLWPDRQIETLARLRKGRRDVSVVHGHFAMPHGVAAVRLGSRLSRPVVVTLHGSDVNRWPATRRGGLRELSKAVHGADVVIAVSRVLAEKTLELTGRRPLVLPIGIDLEAFRAGDMASVDARKRIGWPLTAPIVTFVGSLLEGKGVRDLIAAAHQLPDDVLVILVGDGPLRREIAQESIVRAGRVRLAGAVGHEDIPTYLAASDVIVLPSHSEGLPTVLVEAGAMGVPVVATSVGGIPELLGSDGGWLVDQGHRDALAAALIAALSAPEERSRRARNLQRTVFNDHDALTQAVRLVDIYRGLAK